MDSVDGGGVFVDDIMIHRADGGDAVHPLGHSGQVLTDLNPVNTGVDRVIVASRLACFGVAPTLGVKGIDLRHPAAEPYENAMIGFSLDRQRRLPLSCLDA